MLRLPGWGRAGWSPAHRRTLSDAPRCPEEAESCCSPRTWTQKRPELEYRQDQNLNTHKTRMCTQTRPEPEHKKDQNVHTVQTRTWTWTTSELLIYIHSSSLCRTSRFTQPSVSNQIPWMLHFQFKRNLNLTLTLQVQVQDQIHVQIHVCVFRTFLQLKKC